MSNHQEIMDLAKVLTGNEHLYTVQPFIKITGKTMLGLILERIVYWSDKSNDKRLKQLKIFYKSAKEWEEELGLSYAQITEARKKLESMGYIQTSKHKVNDAPTIHYYANIGAIKEAITQYYGVSSVDYANLDNSEIQELLNSEKPQAEVEESRKSIELQESEISSYNSTINSTKEIVPPPPKQKGQREITIPAFKVFVEITEYHAINAHWRSEMAQIVGEKPDDLEFWRRVIIGWTGKYSTKHNVEGMLDYYKRREIPGYQKSTPNGTYPANKSSPANLSPIDEARLERLKAGKE